MVNWLVLVVLAGNAANSQYTDPGKCVCDLTKNSCDEYCCCDTDCTSEIISSWDGDCSAERYSSYGSTYCVEDVELYKSNSRRGMKSKSSSSGETCFQIDSSSVIEEFHTIVNSISTSQVTERNTSSITYKTTMIANKASSDQTYNVGDSLYIYAIPVANPFGLCVWSNISFYDNIENVTCSTLGDISSICTQKLDVNFFKWTKAEITYLKRNQDTLAETSFSNPSTSLSTTTCINSVVEAHYNIITSSSSIDSVTATIIVSDITASTIVTVPQKFSIHFYSKSNYIKYSGSPGYQKGLPLRVSGYSNFVLSGRGFSGACSDTPTTGPVVNFGIDTAYSCYYPKTYQGLSDLCSSFDPTNEEFFSFYDIYKKLYQFGSKDDVITISTTLPTDSGAFSLGVCKVYNTLAFDIYYAFTGSYESPQAKIVYAKKYYKKGVWRFSGPNQSTEQNFMLNIVVSYIPYDTFYDPYYSRPRKDTIMPQNVLDPFRTSGSAFLVGVYFLIFA